MNKENLTNDVFKILSNKIELAKENYCEAQESVVNETKGSAGDKHETARAMAQIELENAGKILKEAEKNLEFFKLIPTNQLQKVNLGSLIITDHEQFFISIGLGKIIVDENIIFCLNLNSPIGQKLIGKKKGDSFIFNEKDYRINELL